MSFSLAKCFTKSYFPAVKEPGKATTTGMGAGHSLLSVALTFAVTLAGSLVGGLWLDRRWGTTPLFLLLGLAFGLGIGGFWFWLKIRAQGGSGDAHR